MSGHTVRKQTSTDGPAGIEPAQLTPGVRVIIIIPEDEQRPGDIDRILDKVRMTINSYIAAKKR